MSFDLLGVLPASALVAYLALVLPVAGRTRYQRLSRAVALDAGLRIEAYWSSIRRQWSLTALVLVVLLLAGAPLGELGLASRGRHLHELLPGLAVLAVVAVGLAALLRHWPAARMRVLGPVAALLPRTLPERRLFAVVAVTAGVTEEVVFRGFLLVYLSQVFPPISLGAAMITSAALFGLAHSYQGPLGVLMTGLAGYWLAGLYVLTGSLLLPIVVHVLVDLRLLLALPRAD